MYCTIFTRCCQVIAGKFAGDYIAGMVIDQQIPSLFPVGPSPLAERAGFRFGSKGTHTSRTIMLSELAATFAASAPNSTRGDYASAIIEANCLGKATGATRRLTYQRLSELYALDPSVPLFQVLRRLWDIDEAGRPLLAVLCALARDPLLSATVSAVIPLPPGAEFARGPMKEALVGAVGNRLNDAILDKVARNAASSWTQSGHLEGRTFKFRRSVHPTTPSLAYALYLGHLAGFKGQELLSCTWVAVLDSTPTSARALALDAKRIGLIDLRTAGDILEIDLDRLDPSFRSV